MEPVFFQRLYDVLRYGHRRSSACWVSGEQGVIDAEADGYESRGADMVRHQPSELGRPCGPNSSVWY